MNSLVVYFSKTGNTKIIAQTIAQELYCESLPLNLMKHGRKTKAELEIEANLVRTAIERSKNVEMLFLGTPTEFRKPHPRVVEFVKTAQPKQISLFCTYYGMLGATFLDLECKLNQKEIPIWGELAVRVGTQKYRFQQNIQNYKEKITDQNLQEAKNFARTMATSQDSMQLRLTGACGKDCHECDSFGRKCGERDTTANQNVVVLSSRAVL